MRIFINAICPRRDHLALLSRTGERVQLRLPFEVLKVSFDFSRHKIGPHIIQPLAGTNGLSDIAGPRRESIVVSAVGFIRNEHTYRQIHKNAFVVIPPVNVVGEMIGIGETPPAADLKTVFILPAE